MAQFQPYVCKLDAATQKKAQDELYEDPKNRQGAIDAFRKWIQQQKHMKCPMDDLFLLAFMRRYHYSQLECRTALERHMQHREKYSDWMKNVDTTSIDIHNILKTKFMVYLGKDEEGRSMLFLKPGELNFGSAKEILDSGQVFTSIMYYLHFSDEMAQVHGLMYLADLSTHTMANELRLPNSTRQRFMSFLQKTFPTRMKGLHLFNCWAVVEFIFPIITSLLEEKLRERFKCHTSLESLYKVVPKEKLPKEFLPDDYNGLNGGSHDQFAAKTFALFSSKDFKERIKYLSSEEFYIKMDDKDTDVPTASFRKLNVD